MPTLPVFTVDQIADYLTDGYWNEVGYTGLSYNLGSNRTLTVDLGDLTAQGQATARMALDAWSGVSGINFVETSSGATITFDDDQAGAFAYMQGYGTTATSGHVNVHTSWLASSGSPFATYGLQTYIHELGHALGLGHAGNYNITGNYAEDGTGDNHYLNDSWQMSIMSYFSQSENTSTNASIAYVVTPQLADIQAIENLYGAGSVYGGDTLWGVGASGGHLDEVAGENVAFTLRDDGGTDTFAASDETRDQVIDLRAGAFSSVWGRTENMAITEGSVIENAISGSGDDQMQGNAARNHLIAGAGDDVVYGGQMRDILEGGAGDDALYGEHGLDTLLGGDGNDILRGGVGRDVLKGQDGNDNMHGGSGHDLLLGGAGDDFMFGNYGNDILNGFGDDDQLRGGQGADRLSGGLGNDRLVGGQGNDELNGGEGADTFVFTSQSGHDRIEDFETGDRISLAAVASIAGYADLMANHVQQTDDGVEITWGGSVLLLDQQLANFSEDMFLF